LSKTDKENAEVLLKEWDMTAEEVTLAKGINLYKEELLEIATIESIKQEHIQSIPAFLRKRLIKHGIIQYPNGLRPPSGIPLIIIINRDSLQEWITKPCNIDLLPVQ
jgi:hypothetical protein